MTDSTRLYTNPQKLGFGLMRLPRRGLSIDIEETKQMVDLFLARGFTYFDTAFIYPGSEDAVRKALIERHPRESFTLATKLNAAMVLTEKQAKNEFETSLRRTGAGYFDYYLLHSLMTNNYKKYDRYGLWDFVAEKKEAGLIKHAGFSFHADPVLLDEILTAHPEVDFVQLQINYADWENPGIASRANYEVARKHGKQIVVMEPVKGGNLANPPKAVKELFRKVNPDASPASWAIRFVASLDGILAVLSGMSNLQQTEDNTSYMQHFQPLNDEEQKAIQEAQRILGHSASIPCTACHYCTDGCPKQIPIPEIFHAMNKHLANGQTKEAKEEYQEVVDAAAREAKEPAKLQTRHMASDCIVCRQCERQCPQHIRITDELKRAAQTLEV